MPLGVAENTEALDPVVLAHAALADAAERQVVMADVHDRAVDTDVAGGGPVEHSAPLRALAAEVVERERSRSRVHVLDGLVDVAVGEDRQDRTEDLVVGQFSSLVGGAEHHCGRECVGALGGLLRPVTDLDDLRAVGAGVLDEVNQDRVLLVVDDRGVVLLVVPSGRRP
jgi:hypothetical protein